jgi:hypothetical protein
MKSRANPPPAGLPMPPAVCSGLERKGANAKPNDARSDRRARPGGRIRPGERGRAVGDRHHSRGPRPARSRMGTPWLQPWGTRIRMESASQPIGSGRAHGSGRSGRTCPFVWMPRSPDHPHCSRAVAHRQCHPPLPLCWRAGCPPYPSAMLDGGVTRAGGGIRGGLEHGGS